MEQETVSLILHGCRLAKNLESGLLNHSLSSLQPPIINALSSSCEEIVRVFQIAMNQLISCNINSDSNPSNPPPLHHPLMVYGDDLLVIPHDHESQPAMLTTELINDTSRGTTTTSTTSSSVQEWLRSSYIQGAIERTHHNRQPRQFLISSTTFDPNKQYLNHPFISRMDQERQQTEIPAATTTMTTTAGTVEVQTGEEGSDSGSKQTTPVVQRSRKRKDGTERRTVRVAGPRIGNTEMPPDDGFTWRKYGQKEILGSMFPRGYYRCTHKIFYGCEAKKQVQRLDQDPNTYEVTYYGHHTCHISSTPMTMGAGGEGPSAQVQDDGSNMVVELVDAMFNYSGGGGGGGGSCSNNCIDSIFPPKTN